MAVLTVQTIDLDGHTPTFSAADVAGDTFANNDKTYLHVKNGGAGSVTVTVDSVRPCDQGFDHNGGGAVAAGTDALFGPFNRTRFSSTVSVSYSAVTSVTVAAFTI